MVYELPLCSRNSITPPLVLLAFANRVCRTVGMPAYREFGFGLAERGLGRRGRKGSAGCVRKGRGQVTGRDDFPAAVIEEIRKRAGGRCSVPICRAATTGPSESRASGVTNVGMAAHITAAAPGGPRFDPEMTQEQRRSRENGIWACYTHGKAIDDDEHRYPAELLRAWRDRAEALASEELGRPIATAGRPCLIRHQAVVAPGEERQGTATFVEDIAALAVWGKQRSGLIRMVLYELALNATVHGRTTKVALRSEPGYIGLTYEGPQFGLSDLLQSNQRGGGNAVRTLRETAAGLLDLNYRFQDDRNEWFILSHPYASATDDPCGVRLHGNGPADPFSAVADCDEIHVYADDLWSFSDLHKLTHSIPEHLRGRPFVIHGIEPDGFLAGKLRELLPCARLTDPVDLPLRQDQ